jgi:hypothetical protein
MQMIEPFFGAGTPIWTPRVSPFATPWQGAPIGPPPGAPLEFGPLPVVSYAPMAVTPGIARTTGTPQPASALPFQLPDFTTAPAVVNAVALRRGQPFAPTTDQEVEDFLYDALELLPGTTDVEVRCENARVTLTGSVSHKRMKREIGEVAWMIPGPIDVQNNITIAARRRSRAAGREGESQATAAGRKQS